MQVLSVASVLYGADSRPVTVTRARVRSRTGVGAMSVNSSLTGMRSPDGAAPGSDGSCRWMWPIAAVPSSRCTSTGSSPSLTTVIEWAAVRIASARSAGVGWVTREWGRRIQFLQRSGRGDLITVT